MNFAENKMVYLMAGKDNLQQMSFEELEDLNTKYPYFSVGRLLLAKKMKKENHPLFLQQIQKTALYFSNPFWLHYQLIHEEIFEEEINDITLKQVNEKELPEEEISTDKEIPEKENEETVVVNDETNKTNAEEEVVVFKQLQEEIKEQTTFITDDTTEIHSEEESEFEPAETEAASIEGLNMKLAQMLEKQAAGFNKPIEENEKLQIETEPYYTVDYFASQGIKLDLHNQDKLGTQVRRFTDWLKQMKRLSPQPADLGTSPEMEQQVRSIAATSNEPKEVLTEAMAAVLIKQGKIDKAIQLYIKLSFLEPQKSAYFATRIQELKGI